MGSDAIQGDSLYGGEGNDILVSGLGNDGLYGGTGTDIAVLPGNRADYSIKKGEGYSNNDKWFDFVVRARRRGDQGPARHGICPVRRRHLPDQPDHG